MPSHTEDYWGRLQQAPFHHQTSALPPPPTRPAYPVVGTSANGTPYNQQPGFHNAYSAVPLYNRPVPASLSTGAFAGSRFGFESSTIDSGTQPYWASRSSSLAQSSQLDPGPPQQQQTTLQPYYTSSGMFTRDGYRSDIAQYPVQQQISHHPSAYPQSGHHAAHYPGQQQANHRSSVYPDLGGDDTFRRPGAAHRDLASITRDQNMYRLANGPDSTLPSISRSSGPSPDSCGPSRSTPDTVRPLVQAPAATSEVSTEPSTRSRSDSLHVFHPSSKVLVLRGKRPEIDATAVPAKIDRQQASATTVLGSESSKSGSQSTANGVPLQDTAPASLPGVSETRQPSEETTHSTAGEDTNGETPNKTPKTPSLRLELSTSSLNPRVGARAQHGPAYIQPQEPPSHGAVKKIEQSAKNGLNSKPVVPTTSKSEAKQSKVNPHHHSERRKAEMRAQAAAQVQAQVQTQTNGPQPKDRKTKDRLGGMKRPAKKVKKQQQKIQAKREGL